MASTKQLVKSVAGLAGVFQEDVKATIEGLITVIGRRLEMGRENVLIRGLGTFTTQWGGRSRYYNPNLNQVVSKDPVVTLKFRPSKRIKDHVKKSEKGIMSVWKPAITNPNKGE